MIKFKVQYDLNLTPAERLQRYGIRKAIRIAVNRASGPVKASVVSHAAAVRKYGFLSKSIRIKVKVYPADRFVSIIGPGSKFTRTKPGKKISRGPLKGTRRKISPGRYAGLLERGTKRSKARPWLKPAHDAAAPQYLDRVGVEVGKEIAKELSRQSGGG